MNIKYKGKTPVKRQQKVDLIAAGDTWHTGYVIDTLASMFTTKVNGSIRFYFYSDENVTWRKHQDEEATV